MSTSIDDNHRIGPSYIPAPGIENLPEWTRRHRDRLRRDLLRHGALRLTGTGLTHPDGLAAFAAELGGELLEYTERSTPRSRVEGAVYTSTEYPADQRIPQHNESSYSTAWPDQVFFLCAVAAESGGQTPVAHSGEVLRRLPAGLVERFTRHGVRYTRAYHAGIGLPWQEAFQTDDPAAVERYCQEHEVEVEWRDGILRTSQRRPATVRHPVTGEEAWFNQAHLFHVLAQPADTREALLGLFAEEDLPRNAYLGDGSAITAEDIAEIDAAFDACTVAPDWAAGDLMVVDNILASHGRAAYTGDRTVYVAMTKTTWPDWPR